MSIVQVVNGQDSTQSPFDQIRHLDVHGNEFWYGRELQKMLGYAKWQFFKGVIENAQENLETVTESTVEHFLLIEVKSNGRPAIDYKLSRLACYHVALCCDSRGNDAVKMAKHYFAVKTREAEVMIPVLNSENESLRLQLEIERERNLGKRLDSDLLAKRQFILDTQGVGVLALIQGQPDAVVEKIEKVTETIVVRDGRNVTFEGKSTAELARELGYKTGKQLEDFLRKQKRSDLICEGFRAVQAPYIPTSNLAEVKKLWSESRKASGTQLFLGE